MVLARGVDDSDNMPNAFGDPEGALCTPRAFCDKPWKLAERSWRLNDGCVEGG